MLRAFLLVLLDGAYQDLWTFGRMLASALLHPLAVLADMVTV
jgi:hypothetical protein